MEQIAYSFDRATLIKIGKGALHALVVSALLGLLNYLATILGAAHFNNVFLVMFQMWFTQFGYNAGKEFLAGK